MFKGMDGLMQQAKEMQEKFERMQNDMQNSEVTGDAGAGMVKVTMTGRHDVRRVDIDPSVLSEDKALLEDLLAAAVNDAVRRCLLYTSPSPRDQRGSRMPSSA